MVIIIVFAVIFFVFGAKAGCIPTVELLISLVISRFLCHINPTETYSWFSGIWHGFCVIPNFLWSCDFDILYKAEYYTPAYNFYWWLMAVVSICFTIFLYYPMVLVLLHTINSDR